MFEKSDSFTKARAYALARLAGELSPRLYYHSLAHTRDSVVPAVELLARHSGVSGESLLLIRTAAWYHDLGYVVRREGHEAASAQIAAEVLPAFGYTQAQVEAVCGMIFATRLPQTPRTPLEQILADADLDVLGRPEFLLSSLMLRAELSAHGNPIGEAAWYARQLSFLRQHAFFTPAARLLRDGQKRRNIASLVTLLRTLQAAGAPCPGLDASP